MIKQGRSTRKQKQLINLLNRQHKLARQTNWQHRSNKVQLLTLNHRYYAQRLQNFACSILPGGKIHKTLPAVHIIPRLDKQLLAKSQFTMMQKRKTPHMHSAHITTNIHISTGDTVQCNARSTKCNSIGNGYKQYARNARPGTCT
jgi:hypothetical protein